MKKRLAGFFFCMVMLAVAACTPSEDMPDLNTIDNQEETDGIHANDITIPQKGGNLNIGIRNPDTLNPLLNEQPSVDQLLRLVFEPLIALDTGMQPVPSLAERWEFSAEGTVLTLYLRRDIYWHDGVNMTAADVIYSFNTIKNAPQTAIYKNCLQYIANFEATDDYTLAITYNQPYSGALYGLTFLVIPSHYYSEAGENRDMAPLGNGLYAFSEYKPMKSVILHSSQSSIKGMPYIDTVTGVITPDKETDLYAYEQNLQDIVSTALLDWRKYNLTKQSAIQYQLSTRYDFIGFNFHKTLPSDKNFRQAIAYLLHKQSIVETDYLNGAVDAQSPVNPDAWFYEPDTQRYDYNPEQSRTLFSQLSVEMDSVTFSILVNQENEERVKVAQRLQAELTGIGISAVLVLEDFETYTERLQAFDYDIFIGGWEFSVIPDFSFAFHSSKTALDGNLIGYKNPEMDELLQQVSLSVHESAAKEAYARFQQFFAEELPYVSLVYKYNTVLYGNNVAGNMQPVVNDMLNGLESAYLTRF